MPVARDGSQRPAQRHRQLFVGARDHPRRGALIELKFGDLADDLGHDLDRAGTGPDDRHPLAGQVDTVVPLGGMESGAGEFVATCDLGKDGMCNAPAPEIRNCATYSRPSAVNTCQRHSSSSQ